MEDKKIINNFTSKAKVMYTVQELNGKYYAKEVIVFEKKEDAQVAADLVNALLSIGPAIIDTFKKATDVIVAAMTHIKTQNAENIKKVSDCLKDAKIRNNVKVLGRPRKYTQTKLTLGDKVLSYAKSLGKPFTTEDILKAFEDQDIPAGSIKFYLSKHKADGMLIKPEHGLWLWYQCNWKRAKPVDDPNLKIYDNIVKVLRQTPHQLLNAEHIFTQCELDFKKDRSLYTGIAKTIPDVFIYKGSFDQYFISYFEVLQLPPHIKKTNPGPNNLN